MGAYTAGSTHHSIEFGVAGIVRVGKLILNAVVGRASAAAGRSRFAALPARYLEDVAMTAAERVAILDYEEPTTDGWRIVASHL